MSATYCYWSVCTGEYGSLMENCVRTARAAGVFKEFHVLADRAIEGCECYDAMQCDMAHGLFKLHYLKVGMSRLLFDYFIWIDADTIFRRNPVDILGALGKSPIHVPLEEELTEANEHKEWKDVSYGKLRQVFIENGLTAPVYLSRSAFWIVQREAIDDVYEIAMRFWNQTKASGLLLSVDAALGYAMQILCADPERHLLSARPNLWASKDPGASAGLESNGDSRSICHLSYDANQCQAAVLHQSRNQLAQILIA